MVVQEYLDKSAEAYPDKIAVRFQDNTLTYRELRDRADALAAALVERSIKRLDRVAFLLPKSHFSVVAVFGILKAGAIYVPLDHSAPAERLIKILRDCDIRIVVSVREKSADLDKMRAVLPIDAVFCDELEALPRTPRARLVPVETIETDPAYILYTSGSTGQPKGVVITHKNIRALAEFMIPTFGITDKDVLANHAPMHFDLSTLDMYVAIAVGATLCPVPEKLSLFPRDIVAFIREERLTIWHSAPFMLSYIAKMDALQKNDFPDLRYVWWAGEVFPVKFLRYWMQKLPGKRFFNLFGPTETTVISLYQEAERIPEKDDSPTPIGKACVGEEAFALTTEGRRAVAGEEGELYIGGVGVGAGYWNDRTKTDAAFVQNPLHDHYRDIVYKTGDLVRLRPDHAAEFLGRSDHQVKIRGYRVELGEIEAALYAHSDITECAVIPVPDPGTEETELAAFISAKKDIAAGDVKEYLKEKVPVYMIPRRIVFMAQLPITSSGKIDRVKLKEL